MKAKKAKEETMLGEAAHPLIKAWMRASSKEVMLKAELKSVHRG